MPTSVHSAGYRRLLISTGSLVLALALSACGGGSGAPAIPSVPSTPPATPTPSLPPVDISAIATGDTTSSLPAGWSKGAFIEIYVRGYKDSDGDGIGDLRGLTQSLDYLRDLGIKGIWLMPVTRSQDADHGYAVSDYRNIETGYGNLADFDELLKQAHARGIGIILDYVMNHSAAQNPLFINSSAAASNDYRSWYVWKDSAPAGWSIYGTNPWYSTANGAYFAAFWSQMPDFNLLNPKVVSYHQDNLRFWLNRGVDGFRFDAVGHLVENGPNDWYDQPQNYPIMSNVHQAVNAYQRRFMVCEAPADVAGFSASTVCGSAFGFGHNYDIVNAAKGKVEAINAVANYFKTMTTEVSTMISNHDSFAGDRLWDQVGGDIARYKLAAATYLLQPGTPFIYYGEEIGMAGAASLSGDPKLRTPMSWTNNISNAGFSTATPFRALSANVATQNVAAQIADPNSIYRFYKAMLGLRNSRPSLSQGNYSNAFASGSVMGFQRQSGNEKTLVLINYGTSTTLSSVGNLPANASLANVYPQNGTTILADGSGNAQIPVAAQSVLVLNITP
ncbi:alpha-amylase [Undibacterium sp. Jales W-56]|uniref:alpha-amylase family glycosyl hydrolase n=1 Tax=Undibacterium sp. Jales W-56 TaxID=2897325 RepID=UPI0021D27867|nr:alpha-amylase family glycosyl hydrolase [Undibacterium sp. Jales W-56]MCU6434511.1 alpha-amylase [Undibacterium sp. Jales W-56]